MAALAGLKRLRPHWPRMLIVVALAAAAAALLRLPVATIETAFGGIPQGFPRPALPRAGMAEVIAVLPNALSFTLLGAIESLLSAVVADGMTGRRHRSNMELVAQGVANVGSGLFGGFCVTGTIARTATNVRAGAQGPVAGMAHSAFLLVFVLVAAPLAGFVPLAALAAVLAVVAWDMVEKPAIRVLLRASWGDAAVLLVTFGLTIFRDLSTAIVVGFALGAMLFINRMSTRGRGRGGAARALRAAGGGRSGDGGLPGERARSSSGRCRRSGRRSTGSATPTGCWSSTSRG